MRAPYIWECRCGKKLAPGTCPDCRPSRRNPIKPGRFWARSSAGVFMNQQRRKNNGY
jgi:hypothetical protein